MKSTDTSKSNGPNADAREETQDLQTSDDFAVDIHVNVNDAQVPHEREVAGSFTCGQGSACTNCCYTRCSGC